MSTEIISMVLMKNTIKNIKNTIKDKKNTNENGCMQVRKDFDK